MFMHFCASKSWEYLSLERWIYGNIFKDISKL